MSAGGSPPLAAATEAPIMSWSASVLWIGGSAGLLAAAAEEIVISDSSTAAVSWEALLFFFIIVECARDLLYVFAQPVYICVCCIPVLIKLDSGH